MRYRLFRALIIVVLIIMKVKTVVHYFNPILCHRQMVMKVFLTFAYKQSDIYKAKSWLRKIR